MEKELGCWFRREKDSNYLVRYGYKYCSIFKNAADDWSDPRKEWVKKTAKCLQEALLNEKEPIDCPLLESHAFDSHPGCYRGAGFCELSKMEKASVVSVAFGIDVLLSPIKSTTQAFKLLGDCISEIPRETTALYQRASALAAKSDSERARFAQIFWVTNIPDEKLEDYLRFALGKLLGSDLGTSKKGVDAYTAIYGRHQTLDGRVEREIYSRCIRNGQFVRSPECEKALALTGSKEALLEMRSIPNQVSATAIGEILEYKEKLSRDRGHSKGP